MVIDKCLLCEAPYLAPDVPDCNCSADETKYRELRQLEAAARRADLIKTTYLNSLPPRYRVYTTEIPKDLKRRGAQLLKDAAEEMSSGAFVYIHGLGGAGKTHLACIVGGMLAKKHDALAMYINEERYFEQLEASFNGGPPPPDLSAAQILVYDDAGKRPPSAFAARVFYRMLETRWANMQATIITANRPATSVAETMAENEYEVSAILSRLMSGWAYEIEGRQGENGRIGTAL